MRKLLDRILRSNRSVRPLVRAPSIVAVDWRRFRKAQIDEETRSRLECVANTVSAHLDEAMRAVDRACNQASARHVGATDEYVILTALSVILSEARFNDALRCARSGMVPADGAGK